MAYTKGELELVTAADLLATFGEPDEGETLTGYDNRGTCEGDSDSIAPPFVQLPHSCDNWVIGGPDNVRTLIADLQAMLKRMK